MNILCIETSAALCSVAIVKNDEIFYCENGKTMAHAEILMDLINECIHKSGIKMKELDAVALSGGPGSYTGLRIGCSSAKGICYALNIPLIAIDTLKITAETARQKLLRTSTKEIQYFWAMTDARRMEVYHALFSSDLEQLTPTLSGIITDEEFVPEMAKKHPILLCGDGAAKAVPILKMEDAEVVANAKAMCELATDAFNKAQFVDVAYYEPFYLKQANITVSKTQ